MGRSQGYLVKVSRVGPKAMAGVLTKRGCVDPDRQGEALWRRGRDGGVMLLQAKACRDDWWTPAPPPKLGSLGQVLPQQEPALQRFLGCAPPSCEG